MVTYQGRLYRVDDDLMIKDRKTDTCYVIYDIDETQPYLPKARPLDPDMTKAYIDSAKLSGTKKTIWANLTGSKLMTYMIPFIVAGCILYGILSAGGI